MPVIDRETGEQAVAWFPGGYRVTFTDGHWVSATERKGQWLFTVHAPGAPVYDFYWNKVGVSDEKIVAKSLSWDEFQREYSHCGMPYLTVEGMTLAQEQFLAGQE